MHRFAIKGCFRIPKLYVFENLGMEVLARALLESLETAERPDHLVHL
jgi:hypothetical protein